ncbi:hypothetical protein PV05_00864 [Exophiala xenobiotica]|uniref:C2H2-type domain-containing protein n=1 Tax=Exophiala xenobiotica TaxID=348802 RepID=A0A0D2EY58_9EURO|nr:uncharacterized protein PV05_00864 [Exophiala xenobiotica]KIW60663.1 hypothetical protein PV05_00864 [Exophiala xenobiotica]
MKVKCTYEDCFKHFSTQRAMITHKEKDPDHSYCKLCDVDCEDDMHLFIHQLGTPAHSRISGPQLERSMLTLSQSAAPSVLKSSKAPQAEIGMSNREVSQDPLNVHQAYKL